MFERAFLTEDRPEPREWVEALEDLSQKLKQCSLHPGHHYFQELRACPWCDIESQTGLMLFPFVSGNGADGEEAFNIFTVENLIASFGVSPELPVAPPKPSQPLAPSPEIYDERKQHRQQLAMFALIEFIVVSFLTGFVGAGTALYIGIMVMIVLLGVYNQSRKIFKDGLKDQLEYAKRDLAKIELELTQTDPSAAFEKNLARIKQKIADYQNIQLQSRRKLKSLRDEAQQYKLNVYLSSFKLAKAEISGIEPKRLADMKILGIRSAADIQANHLRSIEAIDSATRSKLLEWRKNLENNFELSAEEAESLETRQTRFINEVSETRRKIEREIELLLGNLRSGAIVVRQRRHQAVAEFENAARRIWQAESNLEVIGGSAHAIVILIIIMLSSIGIFTVFQSSSPSPAALSKPRSYPNYPSSSGSGATVDYETKDNVREDISDYEIEQMYDLDRRGAANTLFRQAQNLSQTKEDYPEAEQKLRLAVRYYPYDTKFINQLGYILYLREKYSESLDFLHQSEKLNTRDTGTKTFIVMNYLKMRKFEQARDVSQKITQLAPDLFEGYFNLGLAHKGLKEYAWAVLAFRRAAEINPGDADANYEIAVCLNKLGDLEGALEQYQILRDKDTMMAEKLQRELKIKPAKIKKSENFKIGEAPANITTLKESR